MVFDTDEIRENKLPLQGIRLAVHVNWADGDAYSFGNSTIDHHVSKVLPNLMKLKTVWTPPDEDLYTITVAFAGDESYWDSWGTCVLAVGPAVKSLPMSPIGFAIMATVVSGVLMVNSCAEGRKCKMNFKKYSLLLTLALLMTISMVAPALITVPASAQVVVSGADWPMFGGGPTNNAVSGATLFDNFMVGWRFQCEASVASRVRLLWVARSTLDLMMRISTA
jgi:hypothetical protein